MVPYIGGKSQIAKWVISHFPQNYQKLTYVEVFGGAGWIMLRKEPSKCEVYNDKNDHLVALYEAMRDNGEEFQRRSGWTLHSRTMFAKALQKIKDAAYRDDCDHALQYAISQVLSFSGHGKTYGYSRTGKSSWDAFYRRLEKVRSRLMPIQVECLDFADIIPRYDSQDTFFYIDPPYIDAEHYYKVPFGIEDHRKLAEILSTIKGKFALSYYPHPLIQELYPNCRIESRTAVKSSYGMTRNTTVRERPRSTELLIMNY